MIVILPARDIESEHLSLKLSYIRWHNTYLMIFYITSYLRTFNSYEVFFLTSNFWEFPMVSHMQRALQTNRSQTWMYIKLLGALLKCRLWFSRSEVGPYHLCFWQDPSWCLCYQTLDHTVSSKAISQDMQVSTKGSSSQFDLEQNQFPPWQYRVVCSPNPLARGGGFKAKIHYSRDI